MIFMYKKGVGIVEELLSIIVPMYNAECYVDRCITSIIGQSYRNLEIIIVDDGSEDNTLTKVNSLAKQDDRIRVFSKSNEGVSKARNFGIENARGEFLTFVDVDDYLLEDNYSTVMKYCEYDLVLGGTYLEVKDSKVINDDSNVETSSKSPQDFIQDIFNEKIYANVWRGIFKKSIIDGHNIRFPDLKMSEDMIFIFEYLLHCKTCFYINRIGYVYNRININNAVNNMGNLKYLEDYIEFPRVLKKVFTKNKKYNLYKTYIAKRIVISAMQIRLMVNYKEFKKCISSKRFSGILDKDVFLEEKKYSLYYWALRHRQYWICNIGYYFNKYKK